MKYSRTSRRRRRKKAQKRSHTEILPEWFLCQWICANGFNKRDCHVAVKYFTGRADPADPSTRPARAQKSSSAVLSNLFELELLEIGYFKILC